ncbi:hypothetical protein ACSBR1_035626 [Camellia fascicularis]
MGLLDSLGNKIRSHAQKYFLKVQKNGTIEHVPPPRPKHKAAHPYPQKAPKNVLAPFQAFMAYPSSLNSLALGYSPWDDTSMLIHSPSGGIMLSQNEYNLHGVEADIGLKGVARTSNSSFDGIGSLSRTISSSELSKQGKQGSLFHDTQGHAQKLKEMDPINLETVSKFKFCQS